MKPVINPGLVTHTVRDLARTHHAFDSHDGIERFIALNPDAYDAALKAAHKKVNAVLSVHTRLGNAFAKICPQMGFRRQPSRSKDIHGQSSRCLRWVRMQDTPKKRESKKNGED